MYEPARHEGSVGSQTTKDWVFCETVVETAVQQGSDLVIQSNVIEDGQGSAGQQLRIVSHSGDGAPGPIGRGYLPGGHFVRVVPGLDFLNPVTLQGIQFCGNDGRSYLSGGVLHDRQRDLQLLQWNRVIVIHQ
jgi:hypothetical protein